MPIDLQNLINSGLLPLDEPPKPKRPAPKPESSYTAPPHMTPEQYYLWRRNIMDGERLIRESGRRQKKR